MATRDIANLTPEQISVLNNELFEDWDKKTSEMKRATQGMPIPSTLDPKDIGVRFGPVMDEKTFKEYQRRKDTRMKVISASDLQQMFGKK